MTKRKNIANYETCSECGEALTYASGSAAMKPERFDGMLADHVKVDDDSKKMLRSVLSEYDQIARQVSLSELRPDLATKCRMCLNKIGIVEGSALKNKIEYVYRFDFSKPHKQTLEIIFCGADHTYTIKRHDFTLPLREVRDLLIPGKLHVGYRLGAA